MGKAFYYKSSNRQTIDNLDQVVGQLSLRSGSYIIIGEGCVAPAQLNGIVHLNQSLECKLKAGEVEDKIRLNLWGYGLTSDIFALNIAVNFQGGKAELICTCENPGSASVFDISLTAIQVEELQPGEENHPSAHQKLALYAKMQERAIGRFRD